uniref:Uncharacterized protein n=1 Tax=Ciona savignyi TaxID=51511 RepID=H2YLV3_CIOSA
MPPVNFPKVELDFALGDEHIPYDILNNNGPALVFIFLMLVMMCGLLICWCVIKCHILAALDASTVQNYINYKKLGRPDTWKDDVKIDDVIHDDIKIRDVSHDNAKNEASKIVDTSAEEKIEIHKPASMKGRVIFTQV